jgi:hypothetical protein
MAAQHGAFGAGGCIHSRAVWSWGGQHRARPGRTLRSDLVLMAAHGESAIHGIPQPRRGSRVSSALDGSNALRTPPSWPRSTAFRLRSRHPQPCRGVEGGGQHAPRTGRTPRSRPRLRGRAVASSRAGRIPRRAVVLGGGQYARRTVEHRAPDPGFVAAQHGEFRAGRGIPRRAVWSSEAVSTRARRIDTALRIPHAAARAPAPVAEPAPRGGSKEAVARASRRVEHRAPRPVLMAAQRRRELSERRDPVDHCPDATALPIAFTGSPIAFRPTAEQRRSPRRRCAVI